MKCVNFWMNSSTLHSNNDLKWKKVLQKVEMSLLLHNTHCNPFRSLVVYKFQQIFNSHLAIKLLKASSILTF